MENRELAIILIALVAIVVGAKMGLVDLSGVPVMGGLFAKPGVKVAIVGHASPELAKFLDSEAYRMAGISPAAEIRPEVVVPGSVNTYDVVILMGERYCEVAVRRALADFVKSGRKLIVIGDACTRMKSDENVLGWDAGIGGLGDVMPVKHSGNESDEFYIPATLRIVEQTHAIAGGIALYQNFTGNVSTARPAGSSKILALVGPKQGGEMYYAIVESTGLLAGKVIYYGFDPGLVSREMFLNTLLYLKGAKG